jgi:hypothetical protein
MDNSPFSLHLSVENLKATSAGCNGYAKVFIINPSTQQPELIGETVNPFYLWFSFFVNFNFVNN